VTATRTAGVCLVLAGFALAGPQFRVGTKLTWHGGESTSDWLDSTGKTIAREYYEKSFVGPTVEATYGPAWGVLTGKLDLAQVSFFTSGGAAFRLFPMLGLDLMAEPPTQWRVKPFVWVGVRTTGYTKSPSSEVYEFYHDSETHWRGGLGVKYRMTNRIDLFAETQWYARDTYLEGAMTEAGGLVSAEIGARFALGK
jgi:hypothetical protein